MIRFQLIMEVIFLLGNQMKMELMTLAGTPLDNIVSELFTYFSLVVMYQVS